MLDEVKNIQNTLWAMYKEYLLTHDMVNYNAQAEELCNKYHGQPILGSFCTNLVISWAPVINQLAEDYRNGVG